MEPNFTPEQIEMINRIVFEQIEIMHEKVAEIIADTETVAHQRLKDNGITTTDFYPANKNFLMTTLVQDLIDKVHGGDKDQAKTIITMEAKRLNISVNVEADKSR
ncbi:nitroreductase [Enterobacter hormaechei]|uniref:nitroreductase n=1 Tax=Enterobacter TaxID=547 RepID=UPI0014110841|nr:nitroreductase [Enterobacter hormaechei]KAE9726201.1 nitroreductase [Escherichia coli]EHN8931165.1 nitroreductase [Enterobacter hormaechei]EHN8933537.1 nitroreductase [Enterobacter hormaechei]ELC6496079.1 nitroreductase [Enterobacter hormaechei]ELC6499027.1 nitroreductase [Enterobacter hormaechei]